MYLNRLLTSTLRLDFLINYMLLFKSLLFCKISFIFYAFIQQEEILSKVTVKTFIKLQKIHII